MGLGLHLSEKYVIISKYYVQFNFYRKGNNMVSLLELTLQLSRASDMVSPELNHHQRLVAYITFNLGEALNFDEKKLNLVSVAAVLHDIGGLSMQERINVLRFEAINPHQHARIGWLLLKDYREFSEIAKIIKFHHVDWNDGKGLSFEGETVMPESHLIHLADRIATQISRSEKIINQKDRIYEKIVSASGRKFDPNFIRAFEMIKDKEYFWYDLESIFNGRRYYKKINFKDQCLNIDELIGITKLYARVIDFRSNFTAVHSEGVSAVAKRLAQHLNCDELTCKKIQAAGYIHDIGKLSVPSDILEKPASLTQQEFAVVKEHTYHTYVLLHQVHGLEEINEYASMHHERLDGTGYPFKLTGKELSLGARIMAVADIFTAVTENRPYRKGMQKDEVIMILKNMASDDKIDASIVEILITFYQDINKARIKAQKKARTRYEDFAKLLVQGENNGNKK
jgi:HD-GYP domain-containing protein (c-di-GMP phosphodiesterase class II)